MIKKITTALKWLFGIVATIGGIVVSVILFGKRKDDETEKIIKRSKDVKKNNDRIIEQHADYADKRKRVRRALSKKT